MPRGSNNRLNEKSANRNNANRMFDSQNNNRGGYNVADFHRTDGFTEYAGQGDGNNPAQQQDSRFKKLFDIENRDWVGQNNDRFQGEESFLEGSKMDVTWTAQHGCGNPKNYCRMIVDWTCDTHNIITDTNAVNDQEFKDGMRVQLHSGLNTNTPQDPNDVSNIAATTGNNNANGVGRHESEEYYYYGKQRERNRGLFTADQKLQGNAQINTRQNPGGTRRGLEIPEERDYWPWNFPSPWRTMAILTNNVTRCEEEKQFSQNNIAKYQCVPPANTAWNAVDSNKIKHDNKDDCENDGYVWKGYKWNGLPPVQCIQNTWSQVNNLGNVAGTADGGLPQTLPIAFPTVQEAEDSGCYIYTDDTAARSNIKSYRAVVRMRYNMSVMDYDAYRVGKDCNQNKNQGVQSPIEQNPTVDVGVLMQGLRLAINTAQTGRTFQDRSHAFTVVAKPSPLTGRVIHNMNVQGKRGNIVQTFPAVEYDYWPRKLEIARRDCMAIHWVGSNTHNNGAPGGDGQTGDAGEGRGGSDRHNIAQVLKKNQTYPMPLDVEHEGVPDFFTMTDGYATIDGTTISTGTEDGDVLKKDLQLYLMTSGFYKNFEHLQTLLDANDNADEEQVDVLLNNTPATMKSVTACIKDDATLGTYTFTNTRNNNFSNRDQKLVVKIISN